MAEQTNICRIHVKYPSIECHNSAIPGDSEDLCILHSQDKYKNRQDFFNAVKEKINQKDYDFHRVFFPGSVKFVGLEFQKKATFLEATFIGRADFSRASFSTRADFFGTTFENGATFSGATFIGRSCFFGTNFREGVDFSGTIFKEGSGFLWATFEQGATFFGTSFEGEADFQGAIFIGDSGFTKATFSDKVDFSQAKFRGETAFSGAIFKERANFSRVSIVEADFSNATFENEVDFSGATFIGETDFSKETFNGPVTFSGATFEEADFTGAIFAKKVDFSRATFTDVANFFDTTFSDEAYFYKTIFYSMTDFSQVTFFGWTIFKSINPSKLGERQRPFFGIFRGHNYLKPAGLHFQNLSLAQAIFLGLDLRSIEFHHVDWNHYRGRQALYDEVLLRHAEASFLKRLIFASSLTSTDLPTTDDYGDVERLYRYLKINYESENDYKNAGDFHYGEMEMHRRASKWRWFPLYWYNLYRLLSGYGERPSWALGWLLIFLVGMAGLVWGLGLVVGNPPHIADFGDSFIYLLQKATLQRPTWAEPMGFGGKLVAGLSVLLIPGQAALFFLALRNRLGRRR